MASTSFTPPVLNLPVRLVTRSSQYAIPPDQYMIPSTWKRLQLSQLINKVLDTGVTPVPFDFVHDGQIVRGPLGDWVASKAGGEGGGEGVGETVLELEYIESILPPSHVASYEHDDWVSAVDVQKKGLFLTGSYDNKLRIFSSSQTLLHTINTGALSGGITSISWLPSSSSPTADWLASGNMDGITRVFSLPTISNDTLPSTTPSSTSLLSLHHHIGPVSSIQPSSQSLLTSGWDGTLALFPLRPRSKHDKSVPEPLQSSKLQTKRRKLDKGLMAEQEKERQDGLVEETGWRVGPEAVFRGHKGRVGRAIWDKHIRGEGEEGKKIWSCGWDGSVRGWDVETQVNFLIKQAPSDKVCLDMDQMAGSSSMLVTSHADRTVCLWDTRDESTIISLTLPSAHSSQIPFVRAHPTSQHLIATAGHDGELKIWDVRSPKQALLGVKRDENREIKGEDKLLAGDWDGEILAVGGEGCVLEVYRGKV